MEIINPEKDAMTCKDYTVGVFFCQGIPLKIVSTDDTNKCTVCALPDCAGRRMGDTGWCPLGKNKIFSI